MAAKYLPLRQLIPWPETKFPLPGGNSPLDWIGLRSFGTVVYDSYKEVSFSMAALKEVAFGLPFLGNVQLILGKSSSTLEFDGILRIGDDVELELSGMDISFRFPGSLFKPLTPTEDGFIVQTDEDGNELPFDVVLEDISLTINSNFELGIEIDGGFTLGPVMIGNSGIVFEASGVVPYFSEPEVPPPGQDTDWRGIYIASGKIYLPNSFSGVFPDGISLSDAYIGSGGFSGIVETEWEVDETDPVPAGTATFFNMAFAPKSLSLEINQNTISSCRLEAYLLLPFFDTPLKVDIAITNDGDFTVAVSNTGDDMKLSIPNVLEINIESISFSKEDDELFITITGDLTPLVPGIDDWPTFELKGITISSGGKVQVEGGWIELPEQKTLDFHGFKIEISKLGLGTEDIGSTTYRWVGFSGGIQIVSGIPLKGGVDGLKLMWNPDDKDDIKLQISGISIGFEIADVIKFAGHVEFIEEEIGGESIKGFGGGVAVTIIPLNGLGMDAQFLAGHNDAGYNFFYIYIAVDLPVGIPVVPPVLGLYGIEGLFGYNVTVDKDPEEDWYGDNEGNGFYKKGTVGVTSSTKWKPLEEALALGAGMTLRTLPDTGFSLSTRVLLMVLIPGPVILLEGMATLVSRDASDPEAFPFKILAVLDGEAGTFLANVEVSYDFPKASAYKGHLLSIGAIAEVFFNFNDASDWHIYLGQDTPESKRISAEILSFFKATAYFMLDPGSLRMGVWIGYDLDKKYGPLRVVLQAWIEGKLALSFEPIQAEASILLHGAAELSAFGFGLGLSVDADVSASAPKPLTVEASVTVKIKTPLGDPHATVNLEWEKTGDPGYPMLFQSAGGSHPIVTENQSIAIATRYSKDDDGIWDGGSSESDSINWNAIALVPPDSQIMLNFAKGLNNETTFTAGTNPDPVTETIGNYTYKYFLESVTLEESDDPDDDSSWTDISADLFGTWQAVENNGELQNSQLLIGATTPFEMFNVLEDSQSWMNQFLMSYPGYPCGGSYTTIWVCTDFAAYSAGTVFSPFLLQDEFIFYSPMPMLMGYCAGYSGSTDKGIYTTAAAKTKTCLRMDDLKIGSYTYQVTLGGVKIKPATSSPMQVVSLESQPHHVIYTISSESNWLSRICKCLNPQPLKITFPSSAFPELPDTVELTIMFADNASATIKVYDAGANRVQTEEVSYPGNLAEVVKTLTIRTAFPTS